MARIPRNSIKMLLSKVLDKGLPLPRPLIIMVGSGANAKQNIVTLDEVEAHLDRKWVVIHQKNYGTKLKAAMAADDARVQSLGLSATPFMTPAISAEIERLKAKVKAKSKLGSTTPIHVQRWRTKKLHEAGQGASPSPLTSIIKNGATKACPEEFLRRHLLDGWQIIGGDDPEWLKEHKKALALIEKQKNKINDLLGF